MTEGDFADVIKKAFTGEYEQKKDQLDWNSLMAHFVKKLHLLDMNGPDFESLTNDIYYIER